MNHRVLVVGAIGAAGIATGALYAWNRHQPDKRNVDQYDITVNSFLAQRVWVDRPTSIKPAFEQDFAGDEKGLNYALERSRTEKPIAYYLRE